MVFMPVDIDDRHDDLPVKVAETVHGKGVETVMTICNYSRAEGSLEGKLPTIWTDEKQSREEAARRERLGERSWEEKESEERRVRVFYANVAQVVSRRKKNRRIWLSEMLCNMVVIIMF